MERAICKLGERYRAQWLFPKFHHIADFVLVDRRVILEVDGDSHERPEQRRKDLKHTLGLEREGWAVVRCKNEEALEGAERVLATLGERVSARPTQEALELALAALPPEPPKRPRRPRRGAKPPLKRARRVKSKTARGQTSG